jgi:LexA DNA binding domain-containing protein
VDINKIVSRVSGKCISHLIEPENGQLAIHFVDGSALLIELRPGGLAIDFASDSRSSECAVSVRPTSRQREYLEFIKKYMGRFGVSPAESDIQRHFLVSAPSVNQMMQALERHGFIMRQRGVARSIRLVEATDCAVCGGTHHLKNASPGGITRASTRPPQKRGGG